MTGSTNISETSQVYLELIQTDGRGPAASGELIMMGVLGVQMVVELLTPSRAYSPLL